MLSSFYFNSFSFARINKYQQAQKYEQTKKA